MIIHSPIFSGSITQASSAYANLSGSFTGSLTGSFKGTIDVQQASFANLDITNKLSVSGSIIMTGSMYLTAGAFLFDGVSVIDSSFSFAIAFV